MILLRRLITSLALAVPTALAMIPGVSIGHTLAADWAATPVPAQPPAPFAGSPADTADHTLRLLGWLLGATTGYLSALGLLAILLVVIRDSGLERTLRAAAAALPLAGMVLIATAALLTPHTTGQLSLIVFGGCTLTVLLVRLQVLTSHPDR